MIPIVFSHESNSVRLIVYETLLSISPEERVILPFSIQVVQN